MDSGLVKAKIVHFGEDMRVKLVSSGEDVRLVLSKMAEDVKVKIVDFGEQTRARIVDEKTGVGIPLISGLSSGYDEIRFFVQRGEKPCGRRFDG